MNLKEKKFKDENKRKEMLNFRRLGWTYESIAMMYGVDHSSIYFWCKKKNIPVPNNPVSFREAVSLIISEILPVKVREKNYIDYLEMERRKKYPKLYMRNLSL